MIPTNNPATTMIIFNIFFIAYPIKNPKNPPIPIEVANPPIPIEVARELKSINIPYELSQNHKYMQYSHFS